MEISACKDVLARSVDEWRRADRSFEEAEAERARAEAMIRQLRARRSRSGRPGLRGRSPFSLRAKALEFGLWSAEGSDRAGSGAWTSQSRHAFVLHHLRMFPTRLARRRARASSGGPQLGDGSRWFVDEGALAAPVAVRLARAGQHDAALEAIRAGTSAPRGGAAIVCTASFMRRRLARPVGVSRAWIPGAKPVVALLAWCDLLPLVPAPSRSRAGTRRDRALLRAALEAEEEEGSPGGFWARKRAAHAFVSARDARGIGGRMPGARGHR